MASSASQLSGTASPTATGFSKKSRVVDDGGEIVDAGADDGELHGRAAVLDVGDDAGEAEALVGGVAEPHAVGADADIDRRSPASRWSPVAANVPPPGTSSVDHAVAAGRSTRPEMTLWSPMKRATKAVAGRSNTVARMRRLLDAAVVHDDDQVGQRHRLFLAVRDMDEGDAERRLQLLQFGAHADLQERIERRQRLVEQQRFRIGDQRAGERDALLLAAGKLRRTPVA